MPMTLRYSVRFFSQQQVPVHVVVQVEHEVIGVHCALHTFAGGVAGG